MNQSRLLLSLLFSSFLLIGCAAKNEATTERPHWIEHAHQVYPADRYLTAVGQGDDEAGADDKAKMNLIEIFSLPMRIEAKKRPGSVPEYSILGETSVNSHPLQNSIEIKERWSSENGVCYTLAMIDRVKLTKQLTDLIHELDDKTAHLLDFSRNTAPNTLLAFNTLWSARNLQITRKADNEQLKYMNGKGIDSKNSSEYIERLIKQKLASLNVSVDSNSYNNMSSLQAALSHLGVKVVDKSPLHITSRMDITEPSYINTWFWLRGSYEMTVIENGQVISRKRWPIKVSTKEAELLVPRLQDKIKDNLNGYLQELFREPPAL
jgi:hypothetical protein